MSNLILILCLYRCCVGKISSLYVNFYNFLMWFLLFNCINTSQYTYLNHTFYILSYFIVISSIQKVHAIFHGSNLRQQLDKKKENCLKYSGWHHLRPIFYVLSKFHVHFSSETFTLTFCWVKLEKTPWEMVTNCPQIA